MRPANSGDYHLDIVDLERHVLCSERRDASEIEITPEMIEAGVSEWLRWQESDDYSARNLVRTVYLAMRRLESSSPQKEAG